MDAEGLTHDWAVNDSVSVRSTFYRSYNLWDYQSYNEGESSIIGFEELSFKNRTRYMLNPRFTLIFGGSGKRLVSDYEYIYKGAISIDGIIAPVRYNGVINDYRLSAFGEAIYTPFGPLTLTIGSRVDYIGINDDSDISIRVGSKVKITDKLTLGAAVGRFYQPPDVIELIGSKHDGRDEPLYAGYADHYILGLTYSTLNGFEAGVEGYYKAYKKLPIEIIRDYVLYVINAGEGEATGCDLFLQKRFTGNYFVRSSYSLAFSTRKTKFDSYSYPSDFEQTHIFNIASGYEIFTGVTASVRYRYATGRPYTSVLTRIPLPNKYTNESRDDYYAIYGFKNSARYPAYQRLDVRLDKLFRFEDWSLRLYIDCLNITNHVNVIRYTWNNDYTERFTKKTFGFLPLFGGEASF